MKNKARRQVFSLILSLCMALALLPAAAPAQATDDPPVVGSIVKDVGIENFYEDYADAIAAVAAGLEQMAETIDLSEFNLTFTDINELNAIGGALYNAAQSTHPEYFWTDKLSQSGRSTTDDVNWYLSYIKPTYKNYTTAELTEMKAAFAAEADYYLNLVRERADVYDDAFSQAVLLHDELAMDASYLLENDNYAFLVNKVGLCENYSRIYAYLLGQLGFSSELVDSHEHEWIKLDLNRDGIYYNVDLTWDDPTPNQPGRVQHTYFLLSDDEISKETSQHSGFPCINNSFDTHYDAYTYHAYKSRLCKLVPGGVFYAIGGSGLVAYDYNVNDESLELPMDQNLWPAREYGAGATWNGIFSGLDSYDGWLYYNLPQAIYKYDAGSGTSTLVCSYDEFPYLPAGQDFYGLHIRGNTLYANVSPSLNTAGTEYELMQLQPTPAAQVFGHSLSLDGQIGVNTYLLFGEDITDNPTQYQVEFYNGETRVSATQVSDVESTQREENGNTYTLYPFRISAASNEMDTVFTMRIRNLHDDSFLSFADCDGNPVDEIEYAIRDYLSEAEENGSEALQPLARDMQDYGTFSKHYFRVLNEASTEDLPEIAGFEPVGAEELEAYAYTPPEDIPGFHYVGTSLLLENETSLRMYFESDAVASLTISVGGDDLTISEGQGMHYVQVSDIGAPQLDTMYSFSISNGSENTSANLGPLGYAHRALSQDGVEDSLRYLMMALYHYNQSANVYFDA